MSDGSGGAPQLDERTPILEMERDWLLGAWAAMAGIPQAQAEAEMLKHTSKFRGEALAASPGAGELDLTDDEIRALAESAERGADFLDIQGVHALTGVAKLRARLDRKDDDG